MVNPWVEHVKQFAKQNNKTYACAIPEAAKTYIKKTKEPTKKEAENKKREEVNNLENELKEAKNMISEADSLGYLIKGGTLSGSKRLPPSKVKERAGAINMYNRRKEELEKLTGKQYPALPPEKEKKQSMKMAEKAVSYTHLTLPTKRIV